MKDQKLHFEYVDAPIGIHFSFLIPNSLFLISKVLPEDQYKLNPLRAQLPF